jgi:hypothetical protein
LQRVACAIDDEGLTLQLDWRVLQRPTRVGHVFVHVLQDGNLVAQQDAPPDEQSPVDAWLPSTEHTTTRYFPEIITPAVVRLGFYQPFTQERWPITFSDSTRTVDDNYLEFSCP